ncbi:hypothetical protein OAH34_02970 [bacterium]|nr:hypothetical protein [bacterium]
MDLLLLKILHSDVSSEKLKDGVRGTTPFQIHAYEGMGWVIDSACIAGSNRPQVPMVERSNIQANQMPNPKVRGFHRWIGI